MNLNRVLDWDGCNNVRDLGGLNASNGYKTRWGAVVRSDHPAKLTAKGWSQLYEHGIRTIISLRTHGLVEEDYLDTTPQLADITNIEAAIEDFTDADFIKQWVETDLWCTPLYFRDALQRWPERHVAVIRAIAQAQPAESYSIANADMIELELLPCYYLRSLAFHQRILPPIMNY